MKKKSLNSEINIFEVFFIIWNGKFSIILINILFIILGLIFYSTTKPVKQIPNEIVYKIKININPISLFEEFGYSDYNFHIESKIESYNSHAGSNINQLIIQPQSKGLSRVNGIFLDRKSLYNYFIFQLKDEYFIKDQLANFLNKFESYQKYSNNEDNINRIIGSIKILPNENSSSIDFQHYNLEIELLVNEVEILKLFFNEYQKLVNHRLKTFFAKEFKKSTENMIAQINYEISRINQMILSLDNNPENSLSLVNKKKELVFTLEYLNITKQIETDKSIKILKESPLNSENFNGARFDMNSLDIKQISFNNQTLTIISIVLSSIFFGSIISILYVFIIHAYRKKVSN